MKNLISDWLIDILSPVVRALVRVAIEEVKGELLPEINTVNNVVVNNLDSVLKRGMDLTHSILNLGRPK